MAVTEDFKTPEFVWFGVFSLFQFTQKYTAALKAYGECYGDDGSANEFIEVSHEALWRQLMTELSKLFDREQTFGLDNLCISQLRSLCLTNHAFPSQEDVVIKQLDELHSRYEALLSKNLRNKKLAHYDLNSIFTQQEAPILFSEVEQLVIDIGYVLIAVEKRLLNGEWSVDYASLAKKYRKDLLALKQPDYFDKE